MTRLLARNLYHLMRGAARRTTVDRLKSRGHRTVSVLNFRDVEQLIGHAIENTLQRRGLSLKSEDLQEEVRHEFLALMREREVLQNTVDSLLQEKSALQENQTQLRQELSRATDEFETAQGDVAPPEDEDLKQLLGSLHESLERVLGAGGVDAKLSARTLAIVDQAIQDHRKLLTERAQDAHESRMDHLQRRISKLKRKLQETEEMLARAHTEGVPEGIAGEHVDPGLNQADPNYSMKKELLSEIFQLNVELRQMLNS